MPKKQNYEVVKEYQNSWYALTTNRLLMTQGPLNRDVSCDVCVVGGGFTGMSAALELVQKGLSVVILEARELASSAPGRNGGHLLRGFGKSPDQMIRKFGLADTRFMCNVSLEGLALILGRIAAHDIKCALKFGHLTGAVKEKHVTALKRERDAWDKIGHTDVAYITRQKAQQFVRTERYKGGLFDPKGAHFHPLNYALGIAQTAMKAGCKIHDETPAQDIIFSPSPAVVTEEGRVNAKFIILAGAVNLKGAERMKKCSMTVSAHMVATAPLGVQAQSVMPGDIAVTDAGPAPDYYQLSSDGRLLFGGDIGGKREGADARLKQKLAAVFPQVRTATLDHCWDAPVEFTASRMPHMGRLSPEVFFAHGFGGHGIIAANIMGKILAEAVGGQAARLDVFAKIKQAPFPGGDALKTPLYAMGMMWDRIRDAI